MEVEMEGAKVKMALPLCVTVAPVSKGTKSTIKRSHQTNKGCEKRKKRGTGTKLDEVGSPERSESSD